MLAATLHDDLIRLGSVRCRGGRDAIRERLRLEAAMAGVTASSCGLPGRALLFVRRLAPSASLRHGFADAVRSDLMRTLQHAQRPWVQSDAAVAEAVLFLDEAELAACLVRDWLRGRVADAWWWRTLLGASSVNDWLRRHVYARGDVFAATTELSTGFRGAAAWYARITPAEAAQAWTALSFAYGVTTDGEPPTELPRGKGSDDRKRRAHRDGEQRRHSVDTALATLLEIAPEIVSADLHVVQRRLLATSLTIRRRLQWARSDSFALALHAIGTHKEGLLHEMARVTSQRPWIDSTNFASAAHRSKLPRVPENLRVLVEPTMTTHAGDAMTAPGSAFAAPASAGARPDRQADSGPSSEPERTSSTQRRERAPRRRATISDARNPARSASVAPSLATPSRDEPTQRVDALIETPASVTRPPESPLLTRAMQTSFGGVFYLLNVALALGLYADFTAPRGRNLDLSPWDFLAAIGRRWFGSEFRKDAIWRLLAELADHPPRMRPERGFKPPQAPAATDRRERTHVAWFKQLLESLQERLVLALGTCDSKDVPERVCRHDAHIYMSASAIDVHLSLSGLPIEIRRAGLDRDPGWIPAAGRAVRFHFS